MNLKYSVTLLALLFAAFALQSCIREDESTVATKTTNMTLPISIDTKAVTDADQSINSLRVYAFTDGLFAGHYYYSGDAVSNISFLLDLKLYSSATQRVMLYAIANETSFLRYSNITSLNASTSEAELKGMYFSFIDVEAGLPMFYASESPVDLNVADDASAMPENVVNLSEHTDHTVLAQTVAIKLSHAVSKVELFATKQFGESANLKITGVRADKQGVRIRNFLFPQSLSTLQTLEPHDTDHTLSLVSSPLTVATTMPEGYLSATVAEQNQMRTDRQNYTALLSAPYYAFENPYGSSNPLVADGSNKGNILHIDYEFNGIKRSAEVNMPPMERNRYYPIYCLFNNEGKLYIDYIVADWDSNEENQDWGEITFDYPTYSNPVLPLDQSTVRPFAQPKMWYSGGSEEGAFCCRFIMWAPIGQQWTAVVDGSNADYEVRVYDSNGTPQPNATVTVIPDLTANDWYTIKVIPKRNLKVAGVEESVKLHVIYTPSWMHHSDYLLINGEQESPAYTNSGNDPESIVITQIEQP